MSFLTLLTSSFLSESLLAFGLMLLTLLGAWRGESGARLVHVGALALLALAFAAQFYTPPTGALLFQGALINDMFAHVFKLLILPASFISLLLAPAYLKESRISLFEFSLLVLISTIGMLILAAAHSLLTLYLGLELMSLALYTLAALARHDRRASEAGLKYFVLGALASGMLLYGMSLLYGMGGSLVFSTLATAFGQHASLGMIFGLVFVVAGLAFKISAAPFHMWTPDVYEGAPTPVTLFFASAPKMAAFAILMRVLLIIFPSMFTQWQQVIIFLAILSMVIGSFAAIGQTNIKRLMAYSSIGHMGFALIGLAAGGVNGVASVVTYLMIYLVMTLGTFAAILTMRIKDTYVEKISDLAGLSQTQPMAAFLISLLMFSLAGIPPLAGFFAKWYVLNAAIAAHLYGLAIIAVLASAISCFYYLYVVKVMYFDAPEHQFKPADFMTRAVVVLSGAFMLFFWIFPSPLVQLSFTAAQSLFH